MILTITPNPAIDVTFPVADLVPGSVYHMQTMLESPGGKGINVANVLAKLGEPVLATGFSGGPQGQRLEQMLRARGIRYEFVKTKAATRRSTIITDPVHGATVFNEAGKSPSLAEWEQLFALVSKLGSFPASHNRENVVTVNGSFAPDVPSDTIMRLYEVALATGAIVMVDTSGKALQLAVEAGVHAIKPNKNEMQALTGHADPLADFEKLLRRVNFVMCTLGRDGIAAQLRGGPLVHVPATGFVVGNPTGAGDSTTAAIARSIARDNLAAAADPRVLARWLSEARALGAATVAAKVAGEFDAELYARLRSATFSAANL